MNRAQRRAAAARLRRAGRPCVGFVVSHEADDASWLRDDRAWFAANPRRRFRLRWPVGDEVKRLFALLDPAAEAEARQGHEDVLRKGGRMGVVVERVASNVWGRDLVVVWQEVVMEGLTDAGVMRLVAGQEQRTAARHRFLARRGLAPEATAANP